MQGRLKEQDELIGFILHQLAAQPKMTPAVYGKLARGAELRSARQVFDGQQFRTPMLVATCTQRHHCHADEVFANTERLVQEHMESPSESEL